jgi:membrane-associated phospholipid phosphatase
VLEYAIPALGLAMSTYLEDSQGQKQWLYTHLTSAIITQGLKKSIKKERPNGADFNSFPSGHATAAFSGAAFLHHRFGLAYGIPAYLGASYVAYSRVYADKHFSEDVIVGAFIGIGCAHYFTTRYKALKLIPKVSYKEVGVQLLIEL